jgi:hypothetical protein
MMQAELLTLIADVWNASAKNVKARPVVGKVYIAEVLWPRLSRFDTGVVRASMLAELDQGQPPQIRNVYERCVNATADWKQGASSEVTTPRDMGTPPANPFDWSRQDDREYRAGRLQGAMLGYAFAANKSNALRDGAVFAGMSEDELWGHISSHIEAQGKPRRGPQSVGDVLATI